jgi:hypothetical protein
MMRAGRCGQITLSPSPTISSLGNSVTINGKPINLTTIATSSTTPKCTGNAFTPATSSNFKMPNGKIILVGYSAGQSYDVFFSDLPNTFNTTVNGCAFAKIRPSSTRPLTSQITINGAAYNASDLTIAEPPVCHKTAAPTPQLCIFPLLGNSAGKLRRSGNFIMNEVWIMSQKGSLYGIHPRVAPPVS